MLLSSTFDRFSLLITTLICSIFIMRAQSTILPIRLITHNIRYATTSPFEGEKPWGDRLPLLLSELKYHTSYNEEVFVCMQEVLHQQLVDVMGGLNGGKEDGEWSYIGVGRDDGKEKGEYSPIVFRGGVWEVETWKTVWLSETPNVPGKGWDAASVRIVTVGTFVHKKSKKKVVGMCTHFDDQGTLSRIESAKLILKVVDDVTSISNSSSKLPVFLGGDLNSEPDGDAFKILNAANSTLQDVAELASWKYGDTNTFTGFVDSETKALIDHVMVGREGVRGNGRDWKVLGYTVLPNRFEDGVYISDHRAVVGDVVLVV